MPVYPGPNQADLLHENKQEYLFQNETIAPGQASIAHQLARTPGKSYPFGASFQIIFSGNPGTFRLDVQTADLDQDSSFVTVSSLTAGLNGAYQGRIELPTFWAKYVRVLLVTLTNPVNTSVLVSR